MYIMCILRTFASANLPEKYENPQSIYTNKKSLIANLIRRNRDSSRGVELQRSTPRRSVKVEAATRCSLCRQPIRHTKDCSISAVQWHTRSCTAGTRPVFLSTRSLPTAATPRGSNFGIQFDSLAKDRARSCWAYRSNASISLHTALLRGN